MNAPTKRFLRIVIDGKRHTFNKLPKGIGVGTVNFCIEQGLVRTKKVDRKRKGDVESYRIALAITKRGRAVLQS